jgi:hypothetical protein
MDKRTSRQTARQEPAGFRARFPKQLSGRVTAECFDIYEALRDTLRLGNGELFERGAELLVKQLNRDDRGDFDVLLQRIKRQRPAK